MLRSRVGRGTACRAGCAARPNARSEDRMSRRAVPFALVALLTSLVAFAADENKPANKAEFMKTFTGPDSFQAGKAIEKLNPDIPSDYELLKLVLAKGNWFY